MRQNIVNTANILCIKCHGYNCLPQSVYTRSWQEVHNYFSIWLRKL